MIDNHDHMEVSTFQKPKDGNDYSGDSYFYFESEDFFICALADGLGSGEVAKASSEVVIDVIKDHVYSPIDDLLSKCNQEFLGNDRRGSVLGILKIDYHKQSYSYVSLGNVGIIVMPTEGRKQRNIPVSGYLSGIPFQTKVQRGAITPGTVFFMFSDGVDERQLTKEFYNNQSMPLTIEWFALRQEVTLKDDTTLIAMKYTG
ncbi:SpoIIE family protein phosphatase [Tenuibacillus multivorans]|uniref:Negative regulator of sigma-B (Phosphoserine phosphatase) n=1 Tax=Tenuibacillus multivorans TaxID=237069 RepID=A0A1H0BBY3_9BACI|nr:SpoIIE family protein phosphatase [Tenuibacillus multivorans]GEL78780.1 phosphoserine phosphatase RsbX [Tenuibacillus multivorans]SDN42883.1 negative regulator of sigma-B (phosphoserine phosphatase) [Tenuibacillus multivorans]